MDTAPVLMSDCPRCSVASRQRGIGLRAGEIRLRLHDLLIEIGRVDFGEQLAGLDRRADVDFPLLQITADARIDLRLRIGFEPARQIETCVFLPCVSGSATATAGTACASVHSLQPRVGLSPRRHDPMTTTQPATIAAMTPAMRNPRRETPDGEAGRR